MANVLMAQVGRAQEVDGRAVPGEPESTGNLERRGRRASREPGAREMLSCGKQTFLSARAQGSSRSGRVIQTEPEPQRDFHGPSRTSTLFASSRTQSPRINLTKCCQPQKNQLLMAAALHY